MFDNISSSGSEQLSAEEKGKTDAEVFFTAVLNSLNEHVAVVDREGKIIAVNEAWKKFARENSTGVSLTVSHGINYLEVCRSVSGDDSEFATRALEGIESVLRRKVEIFEMEYPCSSPTEERWFAMNVVPLKRAEGGAVITHANITRGKKAEEELRIREKQLKESGEEYQALARKLISAREDTRRHLARELHDSFSQRLAMVSMLAAGMELNVVENENIRSGLDRIKNEISKLSEEVHDIARQLHPRILEDLGLRHALESLCEGFKGREGIPVELNFGEIPEVLPQETALNIYRVVQESLNNAAKHAGASRIWLELGLQQGSLRISVRDDGRGFDLKAVKAGKRLGLAGMRERAALIDGDISICSEPGKGTEITLEVNI
ncbi:MAG: PAS domain-containing protein [Candidatus Latescibacteria bacterium]|nr:PAS domain-containing protein [bacterium]MBD3423043.1 PAS domain-containing protein [Candidatus Latescibacterota bacterium]